MLPEVKAYLTVNFQTFVYLFALSLPIFIAMLAYVIRGVLRMTLWYAPAKKHPYYDIFFWVALALVGVSIWNGYFVFIGEVRSFLSQNPSAQAVYGNREFVPNYTQYSIISIVVFLAGAVSLFFIEKREKFLGAVPFYTILLFLASTPLLYNVQFEREGQLPKDVAGTVLGLQLLVFLTLHWALNRKLAPIKSNIYLPLGLFMGWVIIGFFIFPYQLNALKNIQQLYTYAMIFLGIAIFVKSERYLRLLIWTTIISANISVVWGLMRFFGINIFGLAESYFKEPKAGKSFLLSGFFANPNYFSEFLAVVILVCLGLAFYTKHRGTKALLFVIAGVDLFHVMLTYTRAAWVGLGIGAIAGEFLFLAFLLSQKPFASTKTSDTGRNRTLVNLLASIIALRVLIMLLATYLMFTKGLYNAPVILAQIIGLAALGLEIWQFTIANKSLTALNIDQRKGQSPSLLETPIGATAVTVISLLIVFGSFYAVTKNLAAKTASYPHAIAPSERAASLADFKGDETFRNRLNMWKVAWKMIQAHPVFGNGLGSFETDFLTYQDKMFEKYSEAEFKEWFHNTIPTFRAHNDHIQTIAELGIFGFLLWVWLWVAVFITAWRAFGDASSFGERFFILGLFASLVSINVSAMFSFPFHEMQTGGMVFMVVGVLAVMRHKQVVRSTTELSLQTEQGKKPSKTKAIAEIDITEYEKVTGTNPAMHGLKILVFIAVLMACGLGMYSEVQHFRSNTFFAWGSRFISAQYNDYNSARDIWFKRAVELNPSNGRAEFFWGWAHAKTEQYAKGVELLRHSQLLYPQTDTHYTLGLSLTWWGNLLASQGDQAGAKEKFNEAVDAFKTAAQRLPTRLEYYTELVKLLNRLGRFEEAATYSDRAIIVYNWVNEAQNVEYMFYLWKGQALIAQNKLDEAIEVLKAATTLVYNKQNAEQKEKGARPTPLADQPQAYLLIGQAYERKGDLNSAEEYYNIYLTKINNVGKENQQNDIYYYQGRLYEKMADSQPDDASRLKYKDRAQQKYLIIVEKYEKFEKFKEKSGGAQLTAEQMKTFTSQNGKPLPEKTYTAALDGLGRIRNGQPYPTGEELLPIESESVGVGEAEVKTEGDE